MRAAGQLGEHPACVCLVSRLPEDAPVEHDDGVGSDDGGVRGRSGGDGQGLGPGIAHGNLGRRHVRRLDFVGIAHDDAKRTARSCEQLLASRRPRCQYEFVFLVHALSVA